MDLVEIDRCESTSPWFTIKIPSQSEEGKIYDILVPMVSSIPEEFICECPGFIYKGHCRHQLLASATLCRWNEVTGPETQVDKGICPRCQGETVKDWEFA